MWPHISEALLIPTVAEALQCILSFASLTSERMRATRALWEHFHKMSVMSAGLSNNLIDLKLASCRAMAIASKIPRRISVDSSSEACNPKRALQ